MFYVPETPSANSSARATPVQFVKTSANDTPDLVHASHAFQISFVGMSVTPHDLFANNELLLCSIRKRSKLSDLSSNTSLTSSSTQPSVNTALTSEEDAETMPTVQKKDPPKSLHPSFTLRPDDIPFIHYDPVIDGHDVGSRPDTFVPVPGSKRLYLQRAGTREANICVRFTVMEIDKLSEEQMAAVKSIENLGQSVGKAAATIPYLKPVGWLLKMANFFGKSAMRKLSNPDHVISRDVAFLVAGAGSETNLEGRSEARSAVGTVTDEPYGNYLRVRNSYSPFPYVRTAETRFC